MQCTFLGIHHRARGGVRPAMIYGTIIPSEPCRADNALSARGHTTRAARDEARTIQARSVSLGRAASGGGNAVVRSQSRSVGVRRTMAPREAALPV